MIHQNACSQQPTRTSTYALRLVKSLFSALLVASELSEVRTRQRMPTRPIRHFAGTRTTGSRHFAVGGILLVGTFLTVPTEAHERSELWLLY